MNLFFWGGGGGLQFVEVLQRYDNLPASLPTAKAPGGTSRKFWGVSGRSFWKGGLDFLKLPWCGSLCTESFQNKLLRSLPPKTPLASKKCLQKRFHAELVLALPSARSTLGHFYCMRKPYHQEIATNFPERTACGRCCRQSSCFGRKFLPELCGEVHRVGPLSFHLQAPN